MEQKNLKELDRLRKKIDEIDLGILGLLEKRWETTRKIGIIKRKKSLRYYDPKREEEIREKVSRKTRLNKKFVKNIFKKIMKYCRNGEKRWRREKG